MKLNLSVEINLANYRLLQIKAFDFSIMFLFSLRNSESEKIEKIKIEKQSCNK